MILLDGYEELLSWFGIRRGAYVLLAVTGSLTTALFSFAAGLVLAT